MKRSELLFILFCLSLAVLLRFAFWTPSIFGSDFLYHATIVEQSLEKGRLEVANDRAVCYEGTQGGHPIGFYFFPYLLSHLLGVKLAFILLPVLLGILSLLLFYLLTKELFGVRIALWGLFFASLSIAFVSKSHPQVYRGDALTYPFLLASLLFLFLSFIRHRRNFLFAGIAGALSGFTVFLWNGYPLLFVVYSSCLFFFCLFHFFKRTLVSKHLFLAAVSLILQAVVAYFFFFTLDLYGKGYVFLDEYYFFLLLGLFFFLGALYLSLCWRRWLPLLFLMIVVLLSFWIFWDKALPLLGGFGSINAAGGYAFLETEPLSFYQLYSFYFLIIFLFPVGLFFLFRSFTAPHAFFLGWLLPSLYLLQSGVRYVFFASLPLFLLVSIFVGRPIILRKKFDLSFFIGMIMGIVLIVYIFYIYPLYFHPLLEPREFEAYTYLRETTEPNACVLTPDVRSAAAEYLAHRYYYFHSLGMDEERWQKGYRYLLTNETVDLGADGPMYVLLVDRDLDKLISLMYGGKIRNAEDFAYLTYFGDGVYTGSYLNVALNLTDEGEISSSFGRLSFDIIVEDINATSFVVYRVEDETFYPLRSAYVNNTYYSGNGVGCVYLRTFAPHTDGVYFADDLCYSRMYQMLAGRQIKGMEKKYFKDGVAIYRIVNSEKK